MNKTTEQLHALLDNPERIVSDCILKAGGRIEHEELLRQCKSRQEYHTITKMRTYGLIDVKKIKNTDTVEFIWLGETEKFAELRELALTRHLHKRAEEQARTLLKERAKAAGAIPLDSYPFDAKLKAGTERNEKRNAKNMYVDLVKLLKKGK